MPRIYDIFDYLAGSIIFSSLDTQSSFEQISLVDVSMPLAAFTTDQGHFESTKVPFGWKGCPAAFNREARLAFNGAN